MKVRSVFILLLFLVLFPFSVLALSETTGRMEVNQRVDAFSVGNVNVSNISFTYFHDYNNTGTGGYFISASIRNYYTMEVEIGYKVEFYNMNGTTLDTVEGNAIIGADDLFALNIGDAIYPSAKGYSINDVKTYSITVTLLSDVSVISDTTGNNTNYYIDKIDIKMDVNKANKVNVDETLHVDFKKPLKYIERRIFVNNKVDGYINQIGKLEILSTSENSSIRLRNGYEEISLGKSDGSRYTDITEINLKYSRYIGEDTTKGKDTFYTYIIDPTLDVVKKNISFEIEFPELTGKEKIRFVNGKDEVDVQYEIVGNKIVGNIEKLESNESLAILVDLEEGYFSSAESNFDLSLQLMLFGPTVLLFAGIVITFLLLRKKNVNNKVNVSDLLNISPLRIGYIKKSRILVKDISVLVFELAINGYLKIVKKGKSFELVKLKNYDGPSGTLSMLFEDIFRDSKRVSEEDLYNNGYESLRTIKKYLKSDDKHTENNYINKYSYLLVFAILALLIIVYRSTVVFDANGVLYGSMMSVICFTLLIIVLYSNYNTLEKTLACICVLIFLSIGSYFFILPAVTNHIVYTVAFIIGLVDIVILLAVYMNLPKRSFYADKKLIKINRFESLLKDNSVKQIEKALRVEVLYFRLLPYVYALDLTDEWINKVCSEGIPSWLESDIIGSREAMKYLKDVHIRLAFALENNSNTKKK